MQKNQSDEQDASLASQPKPGVHASSPAAETSEAPLSPTAVTVEQTVQTSVTVTAPSDTVPSGQQVRAEKSSTRRLSSNLPKPWNPSTTSSEQPSSSLSTNRPSHRSVHIDPATARASSSSSRRDDASGASSRHAKRERTNDMAPVKKARTGSSPPRMLEMHGAASSTSLPTPRNRHPEGPKSPLFFSHSVSKQTKRPHTFSASETSSMLSRIREESAVTTLRLPRASISASSPPRSGSTPGSWGSSLDMTAPSLSPDTRSLPPGLQMLHGVGVIELLELDERPTFLIDLSNSANTSRPGLHILYYNTSLRGSREVLHILSVDQKDPATAIEFAQFKAWATSVIKAPDGSDLPLPCHTYRGITWTCSTLRRRFRFISGNANFVRVRPESPMAMPQEPEITASGQLSREGSPSMPATPGAEPMDAHDYFGDAARKLSHSTDTSSSNMINEEAMDIDTVRRHPDEFTNHVLTAQPIKSSFDWTALPLTDDLPEHIKFLKTMDWASTSLGPIEDWPHDLRTMSNLVMGSPHPAAMYWGADHVVIYNAAYIDLAGSKHPHIMGKKYSEAWPEIWTEIEPILQGAWESGQATMKNDNHLFINRHGYLEETFFSWSMVPIVGGDGEVVGLYNPAFENTRRRINERRMLTLREIGELTATANSTSAFWPQVQHGLASNEIDVPFALIYSVKEDVESELSSVHSGSVAHPPQLALEGSIGVPEGHPIAVTSLDMRHSSEGFIPYMRQSIANEGVPVVLSEIDGSLPLQLIDGLDWKGFGDACKTLVVFPVIPTTSTEAVTGFVVMAVNPRRPYDDDYKLFIHLLSRQLATSMASVMLFEEEIRRGQRAARLAALDRQELSIQLVQRTQEASESEYKFTRMAEFAPVGMFIADSNGFINYCNDMWWQISRHSRSEESQNTWMESVRQEDRPGLEEAWKQLLTEKVTISVEFRFKYSRKSEDKTIDTWVLMSAFPERNPDGSLKSIFGCITDISSQKWAEKVQNERREQAVEHKRQQENFIDITSHEMRNPLSAMVQSADQILSHITSFTGHADKVEVENLLESCLDAANVINLCASHQKRIVDDILTLSKIDSNLLAVTPIDEQPVRVVQKALKMFESELVAHDIEFEFRVEPSLAKYGIKWAKFDPSRLRTVLINLMTNAIKFTTGREKRSIIVSLGASRQVSEFTNKGFVYSDVNDPSAAELGIDNESVWGSGEHINIHCSVEDTGPGLSDDEMKLLFQRFQQATPRTHVKYGGSGLGLFISRILTEMQGGQIGVTSKTGVGSKFNFFIQSRKSIDPPAEFEHIAPFKITRKVPSPSSLTRPKLGRQSSSRNTSDAGNPLFDVLIVEDNLVNQKVLQKQLRSCGNNTFVANHGREALQTLQKSRFWAGQETDGVDISVILMDLEMPVMDGMTCARRIRELEREGVIVKHIPIIAVTAYARPEQIESAKAAGIDDVISKPFRIPELIPKMEELVSKYKNLTVTG